jgi:putative DNA primase/helicase
MDTSESLPFRILGHYRGIYYYLPESTQQIVGLSAYKHTSLQLMSLADRSFWHEKFGDRSKVAWEEAATWLMSSCAEKGLFTPLNIRGVGAWVDDGKPVMHLGDKVWIEDKAYKPTEVSGKYIYNAELPIDMPRHDPATNTQAHQLIKICEKLTWENKLSAELLAGWCVIAPVCGALRWRPHLWVTGSSQAGKSTVMKRIIGQIVGPIAIPCEGSTTEAGLRQTLQHDARPVIFDEAESENERAIQTMQRIIELARIASSGGEVIKGSSGGAATAFVIRSCFCFSSINTAIDHYADASRISKLVLRRNEAPDSKEHYDNILLDIAKHLSGDFPARLFARSVANINTLLKNIDTFTDAAAIQFKNQRAADQIGALLAGAWLCRDTREIGLQEALDWLAVHESIESYTALEATSDETRLLAHIATSRIRAGTVDKTIGELIEEVTKEPALTHHDCTQNKELGRYGIKVTYGEENGWQFIISNKSSALSKILESTPWYSDWVRPLRSLKEAQAIDPIYFSPGLTHRGTVMPVALLGIKET